MNRQENTTFRNATFIALRFVLGDAHTDQRAGKPAHCAAHSQTRQGRHDWPCGDEWSHARNRECADACEQAECAAQHGSSSRSGGRAFGCFRRFFCADLLGSEIFRQQRRDIRSGEARLDERIGGVICAGHRSKNSEYRRLLIISHGVWLLLLWCVSCSCYRTSVQNDYLEGATVNRSITLSAPAT